MFTEIMIMQMKLSRRCWRMGQIGDVWFAITHQTGSHQFITMSRPSTPPPLGSVVTFAASSVPRPMLWGRILADNIKICEQYECIFEIQVILFIISFSIWGSDKVENVIIQRWGWPLEVSGLRVQDKKQLSIVWTHRVQACWPSGIRVWHLLQVLLHTECSQKSQIFKT